MDIGSLAYIDCPTDTYLRPYGANPVGWHREPETTVCWVPVEEWKLLIPLSDESGIFVRVV